MTVFLRLLEDEDKNASLLAVSQLLRSSSKNNQTFDVSPEAFLAVPGAPFAYWVSDNIRSFFKKFPSFENDSRNARIGLQTGDDFRFFRIFWEPRCGNTHWRGIATGGAFSPFYSDISLVVNWENEGYELFSFDKSVIRNSDFYCRPGLTWSLVTTLKISTRVLPKGCIFAQPGPTAFQYDDNQDSILSLIAITNSKAFIYLLEMQLGLAAEGRKAYTTVSFGNTPMPKTPNSEVKLLGTLATRAWSMKRLLDTTTETSHAFHLPAALRARLGDYNPPAIEAELVEIQTEIDDIAFDLYGFSDTDRTAALGSSGMVEENDGVEGASKDEDGAETVDQTDGLLSWAAGVAGRFDWRLATGEREARLELDPFDPLPAKSPGMLADGAEPFHAHPGILVDDQGHPNDLAHLIEEVLARVDAPVPADVRRWLQRDFFPLHLKQYSKSRRKAPIYWPISTSSGIYTLWLYYPGLTAQTLYTAVNDFVEPKLKEVLHDLVPLRDKGNARSSADETDWITPHLDSNSSSFVMHPQDSSDLYPNHGFKHRCSTLAALATPGRSSEGNLQTGKGDYDWAQLYDLLQTA